MAMKIKIKKKGEEAEKPAAPSTPTGVPPKITLKGVKIHIAEVNLSKKK